MDACAMRELLFSFFVGILGPLDIGNWGSAFLCAKHETQRNHPHRATNQTKATTRGTQRSVAR